MREGGIPNVVIAGCGVVSAVGCGVEALRLALLENASGLRPSEKFSAPRFQSNIVGAVPLGGTGLRPVVSGVAPETVETATISLAVSVNPQRTSANEIRRDAGFDGRDARATHIENPAWVLANEALLQARDAASKILLQIPAERIGLVLSTTKANITALEHLAENQPCSETARRHLSADLLAHDLATTHGARGPVQTVSLACVSGLTAISQGAKLIQRGDADAVLVIGVDALSEFVVAGFTALKAIDPLGCRPFDAARCGLSPGEAGAAIVLFGVPPSGGSPPAPPSGGTPSIVVRSFGSSNDANHLTGPSRDGSGLAQAIRVALDSAKLSAHEIDYVHAHGTGTSYNDAMESLALHTIFGESSPPVSGSKGMLGHTLGAAGVIETIICVLAMSDNFLPGTPRLEMAAEGTPKNLVREPRPNVRLKNVLKLNTGFGGMNGALILQKL